MSSDELFAAFSRGFESRRFSAGLLIAFIDFLLKLDAPSHDFKSLADFYTAFPREERTRAGTPANTLIVRTDGATLSIRPFYNRIETVFRTENHRFDYPSCAPHATQAWTQHLNWLEALVTFDAETLTDLRQRTLDFVLDALPNQEFDPANARKEPPLFRYLLDGFDLTAQTGEKTGAAYQGIVFGFLRADNPHLQVEIEKVRSGSARRKGIGDIDCWDGAALAISAEVKQYEIRDPDFAAFANSVIRRGALGIVVALEFSGDTVRKRIEALGLRTLTQLELLRLVELWDPIKQRIAVNSVFYYVEHVERSSALAARLRLYLEEQLGER